MIQVPGALLTRFEACLAAKNISENFRVHYKKWLRFYLDFCSKYHRDANKTESLADFQQKLRRKGQTEMQQKQAAQAVSLYFDLLQSDEFVKPSVAPPLLFSMRVRWPRPSYRCKCKSRSGTARTTRSVGSKALK